MLVDGDSHFYEHPSLWRDHISSADVHLALSVDTTPLTGNADMFGIMKLAQNLENGRSEREFKLPARKVVELATIEGAKALGLAERTGSLKKGKRADVIMVGTREVNIGPFTEPAYMLVDSAQASNVDTRSGRRPHPQAQRQADRDRRRQADG